MSAAPIPPMYSGHFSSCVYGCVSVSLSIQGFSPTRVKGEGGGNTIHESEMPKLKGSFYLNSIFKNLSKDACKKKIESCFQVSDGNISFVKRFPRVCCDKSIMTN